MNLTRWLQGLGCALALGLVFDPLALATGTWEPGAALRGAEWSWSAPQDFDLPGARLRLRRFAVRLPPDDAARRLAQAEPLRFARLQFSGALLLLSGLTQDRHWLALLGPDAAGTQGQVSVLEPRPGTAAGFSASAIVPPGARRVLRAAGGTVRADTLESYESPDPPAAVAAHVGGALNRARWRPLAPADGVQDPGGALFPEWRHPDGGRLTVHLYRRARSVALTFWYRAAEAP